MHVVVTAGHVDHGKSTLIRALTGQDPDRLEEERRRGVSIELGYAWTDLPELGEVAFVDVPGHQRFVTTALAGMGPVPVALFVVAADDPWMPQAEEHLAALDALGVEHGLLVVTRIDLRDPSVALAGARARMATSSLIDAPHVLVSGRTGAGLDELRTALAQVLLGIPPADTTAPVRLWIDRIFHIRGAGTVATGTLAEGTITVGDRLELDGIQLRVRGLEALEVPREQISAVARVAVNLGGRTPRGIRRGRALVTPGTGAQTDLVDVRLNGDGPPPQRPVLHLGSGSQEVRIRPLAGPLFRMQLSEPWPVRDRDRAVLRDPGSRAVWGVHVLEAGPPPLRRRGDAARRALELTGQAAPPEPDTPRPLQVASEEPDQDDVEAALVRLRQHLAAEPFGAPQASDLSNIGLDDPTAARLHREGRVLRVAPNVVLLQGDDDRAVDVLRGLESPFTVSTARQALGTSRRVALSLLTYLDRTGRTVRLADGTRRLRP